MSDYPENGWHPDTDSLSAFAEGALPEHERLRCLAHLAECARCREIVFLAQEPQPAPAAADPVPGWRRWFTPIPAFGAMAAVCAVAMAVWLYPHRTPPAAPVGEVAELTRPAQPGPIVVPPPPVFAPKVVPAPMPTSAKARPQVPARDHAEPPADGAADSAIILNGATSAPAAPAAQPAPPPSPSAQVPAGAFQSLNAVAQNPVASPTAGDAGLAAVAGTVTDPTGAPVSGAAVAVRPLNGAAGGNGRTDASGKFQVAGLTAGRYDVQIAAPGFVRSSKQVDLQARDVATLNSELKIGSVSETVEVSAASPRLQTESTAGVSAAVAPLPLPGNRPTAVTASSGKVMLSADSSGALFISRNAGKSWKSVKPVWRGKVVALTTASTGTGFQLTTDAGTVWLSRDGGRWQQAQH